MSVKKIYVTGTSGTGKTTLSGELERLGYRTISLDEEAGLCSWIDRSTGENHGGKDANMTREFVDLHDWVCDIGHLNRLLDGTEEGVTFVFGMATNQTDFLHTFDRIILLHCSPETFCRRIEERTDNAFGKDKDVQHQIIARSRTYADEMREAGAIAVETNRPINEVVGEVLAIAR